METTRTTSTETTSTETGGRGSVRVVDLGIGEYLSDVPSRRFPVYTRGNAGEVWPEVAYPLTVSLSRTVPDSVFLGPLLGTGFVSAPDLVEGPSCSGGVFGGYMYLNASVSRVIAARTPGVSVEQADATFLGTEGIAPPYRPHPDDIDRRATLRGLRWVWTVLGTTDVPHLAVDRRMVDGWIARLPELLGADEATLVATLREAIGPTMELFSKHLAVSGAAGAAVQTLGGLCEARLMDRSAALPLLAGLGEVDSAAPSFELWTLGRLVRGSDELSAAFDAGVAGTASSDGLDARLRSSTDSSCSEFVAAFDRFTTSFASRGPNEWETACDTWGTDPALALALIDRMRHAPDDHDPRRRRAELAAEREVAVVEARRRMGLLRRRMFDRALRSSIALSQARERSKTIVVDLIHVSRVLARELDRRIVERSGGAERDLWFVDADELDEYLREPSSFADVIAERRRVRAELARRVPPFVFDGEMPAVETWPFRTTEQSGGAPHLAPGERLTGTPGCPGVTEGRARVVTDPGAPGDLGPGDVLVAPLTDPSWTPLFVPVEAVVVDVGGQMSHAVIVARELGRPCVVAVTGATGRIRDGSIVRVDGSTGTVTVVSVPD